MTQEAYMNARDSRIESDKWVKFYPTIFKDLFSRLHIGPNSIQNVFDGGCGFGATTLGLAEAFPKSQVWACSQGEMPGSEVEKKLGKRLHFKEESILDYLGDTAETFDLICLGNLKDVHGIASSEEYDLLASRVKTGGYILTTFSTILNEDLMLKHFSPIAIPEDSNAEDLFCEMWQKTEVPN